MSSLKRAIECCLNSGICEKDVLKAVEHISNSLGHFTMYAVSNDIVEPGLKKEIQDHVAFGVERMEKLL